ncbi:hypothetical protein V8E53_012610 [Lactarius tabidus]
MTKPTHEFYWTLSDCLHHRLGPCSSSASRAIWPPAITGRELPFLAPHPQLWPSGFHGNPLAVCLDQGSTGAFSRSIPASGVQLVLEYSDALGSPPVANRVPRSYLVPNLLDNPFRSSSVSEMGTPSLSFGCQSATLATLMAISAVSSQFSTNFRESLERQARARWTPRKCACHLPSPTSRSRVGCHLLGLSSPSPPKQLRLLVFDHCQREDAALWLARS